MLNANDTGLAGRDDLRIRPLIEHPALRQALGLDRQPVAAAADGSLPRRSAGTHRTPGLGRPAVAPSSSVLSATASVATRRTAAPARRFDRRALLESAG